MVVVVAVMMEAVVVVAEVEGAGLSEVVWAAGVAATSEVGYTEELLEGVGLSTATAAAVTAVEWSTSAAGGGDETAESTSASAGAAVSASWLSTPLL